MNNPNKRYGIIGTTVFHVLLLLFLIYFGLKSIPQGEEGILVNLGDTVTGMGNEEPRQQVAQQTEKSTPPPPPVKKAEPVPEEPAKEEIKTQDYDEAPEIKAAEQKKKEAEKKRLEEERKKREEAERIQREEEERIRKEEAERIRKEEAERKRQEEAERKRQEEIARQKKAISNNVTNAFGKGSGTSTSEGENKGTGNQGYLTGDPNSKNRNGSGLGTKGNSFSLAGRSLVGSFPLPAYNTQEYGIVVVQITVDKTGKVTSAEPMLKGTTTTSRALKQAAVAAALKAHFNNDANAAAYQKGTITYHFELD
ncbi:TonB family protein [Marinilabiliaceae bacterium JC017]|nr:TonB family protein [Marinilabiliaceae bacterium JC017]